VWEGGEAASGGWGVVDGLLCNGEVKFDVGTAMLAF
jgi:hypothetical protein